MVDGSLFLDVQDFDNVTQKPPFYTRLSDGTTVSATPLRGALSKAGKYYAKKGRLTNGTVQTYDPVQYSCQKNFAILTTDGYWNTNNEVNSTGNDTYGPDRLDNTDVGQQDGSAPRSPHPMQDDANSVEQERTSALQQMRMATRKRPATSWSAFASRAGA